MSTEYEKMISGELYDATCADLAEKRYICREILQEYNSAKPREDEKRKLLLNKLTAKTLQNVYIQPPFYCDYGINMELGENVFMNFNCTILDCAKVKIGKNTLFGPNVQLYTPLHPLDPTERATWKEYAKSITIGENCWFGGGVIVLAGVTIGDNVVVGAGSVVTKDIPSNSLAVGNPAKVIRELK